MILHEKLSYLKLILNVIKTCYQDHECIHLFLKMDLKYHQQDFSVLIRKHVYNLFLIKCEKRFFVESYILLNVSIKNALHEFRHGQRQNQNENVIDVIRLPNFQFKILVNWQLQIIIYQSSFKEHQIDYILVESKIVNVFLYEMEKKSKRYHSNVSSIIKKFFYNWMLKVLYK